ncbi:hypothetical protein TW81_01905 [Vibrio galatheae]|uniref:Uncharacterized protein n=1 Tax=Vibrio galatheae TaxID=579748 RepID=A0A0F4NPM8_9VIBR|nr:hypothetical protein [Vibrio galatheae]KJY85100.1 hypothetical protein TW81_01905 [Vibrio galatheae]
MTLHAQYSSSIFDFVTTDSAILCSQLTGSDWPRRVELLKQQFKQLPHLAGDIVLALSHRQSQLDIDAVVLYRGLIFPLMFDFNHDHYTAESQAYIHQQARRLKQQHSASAAKFIVPVQVTTQAYPQSSEIIVSEDLIANTMCDNGEHLSALVEHFSNQHKDDQIIASDWISSALMPR